MSAILYSARNLPVLQNTTFATKEEAQATQCGDVLLVADEKTGLIHNAAFEPEKLIYDVNYNNEQSRSPIYQSHQYAVCEIASRHFSGKSIVEIGCGKGAFLDLLKKRGFRIIGIDPAYDGNSPDVIKEYFNPDLGVRGDVIILRHVLEHIQYPKDFLASVLSSNGGKGLVYIEVPCFEWICNNHTWFDIFYEHVNYFRMADFGRMFGNIIESGHIFGGQYMYVVAELCTLRSANDEVATNAPSFSRLDEHRSILKNLPQRPRAIWGAASKGVIFAKQLLEFGVNVDMAIDINPAKQGRFLPGSGLYVASPQEALESLPAGAHIYVMNSNYLDEVRAMGGGGFHYRITEPEGVTK